MKILASIFWLLCLLAVINIIPEPLALWLRIIGALLLLAHVIEFILFRKTINSKGDSPFKSFYMTMLYGVFYFKY